MKMTEFNANFEINRKSRGLKATARHAPAPESPNTADGTPYDAETVYHFFDESARAVRASNGLRLIGEIEKLREKISECESEKQPRNRSLKAVLTSR